MTLKTEMVYTDRDNTIDYILKSDGEAYDLSGATKIDLILDSTQTITDSIAANFPIRWLFDPAVTGKISLKLGDQEITVGSYKNAKIVVYDANNPNGIMWSKVPIKVE